MLDKLKALWTKNHTIIWARIQMLIGAIITVLAVTDPTLFYAYIPVQYLPIYVVLSGVVTELARRYKAKDLQ